MQMLFKIDENLPVEIADMLVKAGHDAKTVNEQQMTGVKDLVLSEACRREQRVLITLDMDFADIKAYPPDEMSGIIVLRVRSHSKKYIMEVLSRVIAFMQSEPVNRRLWVVEESRIRIHGR